MILAIQQKSLRYFRRRVSFSNSTATIAPAEQHIYRTKINKLHKTPSEFYIYIFEYLVWARRHHPTIDCLWRDWPTPSYWTLTTTIYGFLFIMANTYSQLYIHIIFAVKGRDNLIGNNNKDELYKYITGIIQNKGQKLICINGMPNHIHIFIGMKPDIAISDLVRDVKHFSTNFINDKRWVCGKFYWQEGFGVFSYSNSQIDQVVKYIQNQEKHHSKMSFKEEYLKILQNFNVTYNEKYLFEWTDS